MKKLHVLLAGAAVAVIAAAQPVAAGPDDAQSGGVQMTVHAHSGGTLLFPADPLAYPAEEGATFMYSSRPCGASAPFNDVGLNFLPDLPGVDDDDGTAAARHHIEGTITSDNTVDITITSVLCEIENGVQVESDSALVTHVDGRYRLTSDNEIQVHGTFELSPTASTGSFAGIEGEGSFRAMVTCLAHQRDPSQPTCAERGSYTDFVGLRGDPSLPAGELHPGLVGSYRLPMDETPA